MPDGKMMYGGKKDMAGMMNAMKKKGILKKSKKK